MVKHTQTNFMSLALKGLSGKGKKNERKDTTSNKTLIKREEDVNYNMSDLLKKSC